MVMRARPESAVRWGGFLCGTLDIIAAIVVYGFFGARPERLLQGIAAGVLGTASFHGGWPTALLGLCFEYVIAYGAAMVFVFAAPRMNFILDHAILSGITYGIVVYFFMNRIVVPLSRAVKYPFSWQGMFIGLIIHIFCVGLPISLAARRFLVVPRAGLAGASRRS
jgi:hypothetical protein